MSGRVLVPYRPRRAWLLVFYLAVWTAVQLTAQEDPQAENVWNEMENRFFDALAQGQASEAERILLQSIADHRVSGKDPREAQLLIALGNSYCDGGDLPAAKKWLETAIASYGALPADEDGEKTIAEMVGPKVTWLRDGGRRTWADPDLRGLTRKLFKAISTGDRAGQEALLSRIDLYIGWWQSELEPVTRDDLLAFIEHSRDASITWVNEKEFDSLPAPGDTVAYLNTTGWKETDGSRNLQFALHAISGGGWEWRGVVLGESLEKKP